MENLKQAAALIETAESKVGVPPVPSASEVPAPTLEAPTSQAVDAAEKERKDEAAALRVYALPLLAESHDALGEVLKNAEGISPEEEASEAPISPEPAQEEAAPRALPPPVDGLYETVDEEGRKSILTYKEGNLTGPVQLFTPDGLLFFEGELDHGRLCGLCKSYENGVLRSTVKMENGQPHGLAKQFNENGALVSEVTFVRGTKQGEMVQYDPQGNVSMQATFSDDMLNGPFKTFAQEELTLKTTYKNGHLHGLLENFYAEAEGGKYLRTAAYEEGVLQGKERIYHASGSLLMETEYASGKRLGKPIIHQVSLPR